MPVIGLDLGEHSFRAVELEIKKGSYTILNFGHFENPQLSRSKIGSKRDIYKSAIKNFFSEFGFSTPDVILGITDSNVFMRVITLPKMGDTDLKNTISYESEQYIPLPLDQVNVSYQKLDTSEDPSKMDVQLVAAKIDKLKEYVDVIRSVNLIPRAIEPETLAISRAIMDKDDNSGTIILDIGFSSSIVIVVYKGIVYFTRTIPVGGDLITRSIQQNLNLEYMQAEEYKKTYGLDQTHFDGKIYEVIKPIIDSIVIETKRAVLFFSKENTGVQIKKAVVTGGTVMMPEFLMYLVNSLDIEVMVGDPLKNLAFAPNLEARKNVLVDNSNLYTTAIGLAMKGL
jgi:type IV pilus assembly protein PilM